MFGGNNMGRVGTGGGNLLRSVGRSVARANLPGGGGGTHLQEPISSSSSNSSSSPNNNNNNHLYVTSPFASCNVPISTIHGLSTWRPCDEPGWVTVEECDEIAIGPVPSQEEVHSAVSALQQVFTNDFYYNAVKDEFGSGSGFDNYRDEERRVFSPADFAAPHISPPGSEMDWIEPSFCACDSKAVLLRSGGGFERVHDALRLLRAEPLVQKMVKSLSSDEAVWNAVLNNEVVRELRDSFSSSSEDIDDSEHNSDEERNVVKLIFDGTRAKIAEVVEKIAKLVTDLFQPPLEKGYSDDFKEKLRTSFMLSIMVLLVVVVARANKA